MKRERKVWMGKGFPRAKSFVYAILYGENERNRQGMIEATLTWDEPEPERIISISDSAREDERATEELAEVIKLGWRSPLTGNIHNASEALDELLWRLRDTAVCKS